MLGRPYVMVNGEKYFAEKQRVLRFGEGSLCVKCIISPPSGKYPANIECSE